MRVYRVGVAMQGLVLVAGITPTAGVTTGFTAQAAQVAGVNAVGKVSVFGVLSELAELRVIMAAVTAASHAFVRLVPASVPV